MRASTSLASWATCVILAIHAATAQAEPPRDMLAQLRAHKPLRVGMHAGLIPFIAAGPDAEDLCHRIGRAAALSSSDGRPVAGFDVDLAQAAARALDVPLEIVLVDRFDDLLPGLIAGRYDVVMSGLTRTLPRAATVAFTDPYFASGLQIYVPSPARFATLDELKARHARVGVRADTTAQTFARTGIAGAVVTPLPTAAALLAALDDGRFDAVVLDYVNARDAQLRGHLRAPIVALEDRRFTVEHFAFAVRHGDPDWLAWLNLMLRESKASGEFHGIAARYNPWFRSER
jgi:polar amino acid transport system substrate-binding protein